MGFVRLIMSILSKAFATSGRLRPAWSRIGFAATWIVTSIFVCIEPPAALAGTNPRYAAIVVDAESGTILFSRNADKLLYPASLTKVMTLYMTFEAIENGKLKLDQKLKVSKIAASRSPAKLWLQPGTTITTDQAIRALVTKSANDAATVIAEALGGTERQFAVTMTAKARQLGMNRTRFRNASGLPHSKQKSTARDLATLSRRIRSDYPQYYHYFSTKSFTHAGRTYSNHNKLLKSYPGTDGIKTGYTKASGFNLTTSADRNNVRLVGVVLGGKKSTSRDRHMKDILNRSFARVEARPDLLPAMASIPQPKRKPLTVDLAALLPKRNPIGIDALVELAENSLPSLPPGLSSANVLMPFDPHSASIEQGDADPNYTLSDKWGIQVGAFSQAETARDQLARTQQVASADLSLGQSFITPSQSNGQTIYRARFGPMDQGKARTVCDRLKTAEFSCFIVTDQDWSHLSPN